MIGIAKIVLWDGLKLLLLVAVGVYGGLVYMSYSALRSPYPVRLNLGTPGRSVLRVLVWFGVEVVTAAVRAARAFLDVLSETSAEVGEWFMARRNPERQAQFRSRFL